MFWSVRANCSMTWDHRQDKTIQFQPGKCDRQKKGDQIMTKSGSDWLQYTESDLKKIQDFPIWGQSEPFWAQIQHPDVR